MASNNGRTNLPAISEDTVKELLAVQRQELSLRLEEVKRDSAEIAHNQSIAKQSIEAQERDRKHEREEVTKRQSSSQWFILLVTLVVVVFAGYALYIGKEAVVLDVVKVLIGFAGGMGYQAWRDRKQDTD